MRQVLFVLLLPLCLSCGAMGAATQDEMLRAVRQFNIDLHWGRYDEMSPAFAPAVRAHYMDRLNQMTEKLQILDSDVSNIIVDPKKDKAVAQVEISWTTSDSMVVRHTTVRQYWEQTAFSWKLHREVRSRGAPLYLIDEPAPRRIVTPVVPASTPAAPAAAPDPAAAPPQSSP